MKKEYMYILIIALVAASVIAAVYFFPKNIGIRTNEYRERLKEERELLEIMEKQLERQKLEQQEEFQRFHQLQRNTIEQLLRPMLLTGEEAEEVKTIARSDEIVSGILEMLGEPEMEVFRGPGGMAILRGVSKEWVAQISVDIENETVMSVSLSKGMVPWVEDPRNLIQIAERELFEKELGEPILRKIVRSGKDAEVVFLTEKGPVTVKVDLEEGKAVELEKESVIPSAWWLVLILGIVATAGIIIVLVKRHRGKEEREEAEEKSDEIGENRESEEEDGESEEEDGESEEESGILP